MIGRPRLGTGTRVVLALVVLGAAACSQAADVASDTAEQEPSGATTTSTEPVDPSSDDSPADAEPAPVAALAGSVSIEVIATYPHDPDAFTQGLELTDDGRFVESTGLYGESDRRIVDVDTGEVEAIVALEPDLFAEGLTIVGDELFQLTWKSETYIRSDLATLAEVGRGTYSGEGWGLCHDGTQFVMSNGTPTLTFRDTATFGTERTVEVTLDGEPIANLNELECVGGRVLANVWLSDLIVVIDPTTGVVVATVDGSVLRPDDAPLEDSSFALNGIAHDPTTGHFYLTGKSWSVLYEVALS